LAGVSEACACAFQGPPENQLNGKTEVQHSFLGRQESITFYFQLLNHDNTRLVHVVFRDHRAIAFTQFAGSPYKMLDIVF